MPNEGVDTVALLQDEGSECVFHGGRGAGVTSAGVPLALGLRLSLADSEQRPDTRDGLEIDSQGDRLGFVIRGHRCHVSVCYRSSGPAQATRAFCNDGDVPERHHHRGSR